MDYELIDATDGGRLGAEASRYSRRRALFEIGRGLGNGEVGCALSHLSLYERMVREDRQVAVIMEDDVLVDEMLPGALASLDALPDDWDVVTFCSLFPDAEPVPVDRPPIVGEHRICTFRRVPFGAQCYAITRAAADRVLAIAEPIRMPADDLLFRRHPANLRVYGIEPRLVHLDDVPSELVARDEAGTQPAPRATELPIVAAGKIAARLRR
jgi:glycosyl transferase family 25